MRATFLRQHLTTRKPWLSIAVALLTFVAFPLLLACLFILYWLFIGVLLVGLVFSRSAKPHNTITITQDYENMTLAQAILIGCKRGFKNFFALGGLLRRDRRPIHKKA